MIQNYEYVQETEKTFGMRSADHHAECSTN